MSELTDNEQRDIERYEFRLGLCINGGAYEQALGYEYGSIYRDIVAATADDSIAAFRARWLEAEKDDKKALEFSRKYLDMLIWEVERWQLEAQKLWEEKKTKSPA